MFPSLNRSEKNVLLVMFIFLGLNTVFILLMPLLPFIDLPNHLAEAAIYKYYGEPGNVFASYYEPTPWYFPNTFHTIFCTFFPTVELGNKVFHILYILLLQTSLFLVIKKLGGNLWYGLLGMLFTYNYNVTFGFVGFAISIPTTFLLFYFILLEIGKDRVYLKFIIAGILIILFLMHAQVALFGLLLYGFMMLYHYRNSFGKLIIRMLLIPLPVMVMIIAWWINKGGHSDDSTLSYLIQYYTTVYFSDFISRFRLAVYDNFQLYQGSTGVIVAAIFFIILIAPLLYFKPWRNKTIQFFFSEKNVYPLLLLFVSLGCYFFLPDKLPGQSPLFQRFCTIVMLSCIILASVWMKHFVSTKFNILFIVTIFCYAFLWFEYIYTFNRKNQDFNKEFFAGTDHTSRLAGLIYDNKFRGRQVYIHYPNYFLVWNKGIAASKIIDYRFGVVRRVAPESVIPFYHEYVGDYYKPRPQTQYSHLEYILVRGTPDDEDIDTTNYSLLKAAGIWQLYKNNKPGTLPVIQTSSQDTLTEEGEIVQGITQPNFLRREQIINKQL